MLVHVWYNLIVFGKLPENENSFVLIFFCLKNT